jgi:CBS domain-containing protein
MRISDVLRVKGDQVVTVTPDTDVAGLLGVLAEHGIGAVVVSPDGTAIAGIVSERDVVRALAARGAGVLSEPVSRIATAQVHTVAPEASIEDVERLMTDRRFRHVPVLVNGGLGGVVSIGDVVKNRIDELEAERRELAGYITGERP